MAKHARQFRNAIQMFSCLQTVKQSIFDETMMM